jgi:Secretion system C-terminal sorting domain
MQLNSPFKTLIMKKELLISFLFLLSAYVQAQSALHPPRLAYYRDLEPRHTMSFQDFLNHTWDIYDMLDEGKTVYYLETAGGGPEDFVYAILNSGLLDFYNIHGPNGDNKVEVIIFVCQDSPWEGNPFPGNDTLPFLFLNQCSTNDYSKYSHDFGRLGRLCPDRSFHQLLLSYELSYLDPDSIILPNLAAYEADLASCETATDVLDAAILWSNTIERPNLPGQTRPADVFLSNMGTEPLTSVTIEAWWADSLQSTTNWTGYLPTYSYDTVYLPDMVTNGTTNSFKFVVKNPNGGLDQDPSNDLFFTQSPKGSETLTGDTVIIKVNRNIGGYTPLWDIIGSDGVKYGGWYSFKNWLWKYSGNFPGYVITNSFYNSDSIYTNFIGSVMYDTIILPHTVDYFTFRGFHNDNMAYRDNFTPAYIEMSINDSLIFFLDSFFYEKCYVARTSHSPYFMPDTITNEDTMIVEVPTPFTTTTYQVIKDVYEPYSSNDDQSWIESWALYPNPAKSSVTITSTLLTRVDIDVLDPYGRLVYESNFIQKTTLIVQDWPPGVYFIKLSSPTGVRHWQSFEVVH